MGSRYGRNQRRRAREQIAELTETVAVLKSAERRTQARIDEAFELGATRVVKAKALELGLVKIHRRLVELVEPQLRDAAEKVLKSARAEPAIDFRYVRDIEERGESVAHIRGTISPVDYNVLVA